jgi:co-chaperonin GroES (HSP10)
MKQLTPFHDKRGKLHFKYRPLRDVVFLYRTPAPETFSDDGVIEIPKRLKHLYKTDEGTILAVGPGYYDKKGKYHKTPDWVKPGVKIRFDKNVPWGITENGVDGKPYSVVMCGVSDIHFVVEE